MSEPNDPQVFKNIRPYAIDAGGRLVAPGEVAELPSTRRAVEHAVGAGHLVPVNTTPAEVATGDQPAATKDQQSVNNPVEEAAAATDRRRNTRTSASSDASEES